METIVNIPNILTLFRLLLVPVFVYGALADNATLNVIAALAFGIASITDWLDGFAARKLGQVTEFGKLADPIVDRILIAAALVVLYVKVSVLVPLWAVTLIIGRDALMVAGWFYIRHAGGNSNVKMIGKVATTFLMIAVFLLLLDIGAAARVIELFGIWMFYAGVALSVLSGILYIRDGMAVVRGRG